MLDTAQVVTLNLYGVVTQLSVNLGAEGHGQCRRADEQLVYNSVMSVSTVGSATQV